MMLGTSVAMWPKKERMLAAVSAPASSKKKK